MKASLQKKFAIKKKKGSKKKQLLESLHEKWLFELEPKHFVELSKQWNEHNLNVELSGQDGYDQWLNYFKTLSPSTIKKLAATGQDVLSTEAYAALSRWHDIIGNPHRIEKIHQSGLTRSVKDGENVKSIVELAQDNNRLGVLQATRDRIAEKLQKGAGARDTAALAREMTEIMTQIADYEKRAGPKKDSVLAQLLDSDELKDRPTYSGKGTRNTSFASRVKISDVEG